MASAAGFQSVTAPRWSAPMKASWEASTVRDRTRSARRRAATSRRAELTSAVVPVTRATRPWSSRSTRARVWAQRASPRSSRQRYSTSSSLPPACRLSARAWLTSSRSAATTRSPKTGLPAGPLTGVSPATSRPSRSACTALNMGRWPIRTSQAIIPAVSSAISRRSRWAASSPRCARGSVTSTRVPATRTTRPCSSSRGRPLRWDQRAGRPGLAVPPIRSSRSNSRQACERKARMLGSNTRSSGWKPRTKSP